ncbi:curli production assembly/transport protein CsgF [Spirosoma knui]
MKQFLLFIFLITGASTYSSGQNFIYRPNNPNFGGSYLNYSWLLGQAQAQDKNVDPKAAKSSTTGSSFGTSTNSTLDNFSQSIESQILQRITSRLVTNQFGEGELKEGTYRFGTYQVEIRNGTDGVIVRIVDGKGGETSVTVPYF